MKYSANKYHSENVMAVFFWEVDHYRIHYKRFIKNHRALVENLSLFIREKVEHNMPMTQII